MPAREPPPELDCEFTEVIENPARLSSTLAAGEPDTRPAFELLYGDEQRK